MKKTKVFASIAALVMTVMTLFLAGDTVKAAEAIDNPRIKLNIETEAGEKKIDEEYYNALVKYLGWDTGTDEVSVQTGNTVSFTFDLEGSGVTRADIQTLIFATVAPCYRDANGELQFLKSIELGMNEIAMQRRVNEDEESYQEFGSSGNKIYLNQKNTFALDSTELYVIRVVFIDGSYHDALVIPAEYKEYEGNMSQSVRYSSMWSSYHKDYFLEQTGGIDTFSNVHLAKDTKCSHTYKQSVTKATPQKDGKIENKCSKCGNVESTTVIHRPKTVTLSETLLKYTGKEIKPGVTVKDTKGKMIAASNYTVSYINNKKVGTATAKVTFKGNYGNTMTVKFKITKNQTVITNVSAAKYVTLSKTSYTYNGKAQKPAVTVKTKSGKTISKKDYTVSYSNNKNVGKAAVTLKFKGVYKGTLKKTFTILPKTTSISKLTAAKKGFAVKLKGQSSQTSGYQIQYGLKGNFKGAKTVSISKNSITTKKITQLSANKKYYVRVRTYKTAKADGKNTKIYSDWSKAKTVTTKR